GWGRGVGGRGGPPVVVTTGHQPSCPRAITARVAGVVSIRGHTRLDRARRKERRSGERRRAPAATVRKRRGGGPALRLVEAGVVEIVTPPAPAPARSQRSARTTQAATTVAGFHRFTVAVSIAARSERKVVTDRTLKAWYRPPIAWHDPHGRVT